MSRNLAIVDIQTLFLAAREEYGPLARVDYVKLRHVFKEQDTDITDAVAYILASPYHDDRRFVRFLKKNGYCLMRKFAQLNTPMSTDEEKNVQFKNRSWIDAMVWEAIKMVPKYDHVYIVSGNGQFCSVASSAKSQGKKVTVVSFRSSLQKQLSEIADEVIYLDQAYIFDSSAFAQGQTISQPDGE
jgi:uncharacterized LabA/DUF88 family protein